MRLWLAILLSSIAFWEKLEYICIGIVTVGVIGEYVSSFVMTGESEEVRRKKHRLERQATLFLILGLVLELPATVKVNGLTGEQIAELEREANSFQAMAMGFKRDIAEADARAKKSEASIADAGKLAAAGKAEAAKATERAKEADKDAARSLKAAEKERLERVRLEAQIAPRRLTQEQLVAIVNACRVFKLTLFSKRSVEIVSYSLDTEAAVLAQQIRGALSSAGLEVKFNPSSSMPFGGFMIGIQVSGPTLQRDLVVGITESLSRDGKLEVTEPKFTGPDTAVSILIGVKPIS